MKVIILAGGSGARLWPLSRNDYPKQFLKLKNRDKSLFQLTFMRCTKLAVISDVYIVTNKKYKFLVRGQIDELGYQSETVHILLEPEGKNTLPAICYAVKEIQRCGEEVAAVFPSDHLINDTTEFIKGIKESEQLTDKYIITYGIRPNEPHSGYGYIKPAARLAVGYEVAEFIEKPEAREALKYLQQGYLWNSGMFMFRTDVFARELKLHNPQFYEAFKADNIVETFASVPSISIDYGLMEKSQRVATVPLAIQWSDLGSFDSFCNEFVKDNNGNIFFSNNDVLVDAQNNLFYTDNDKTVAAIGVKDLIVVDEKDALLICKKEQSQKVKVVVDKLKESGNPSVDVHLTTYRPWGSFAILEQKMFHKIKMINVLPGKKISLQIHYHRSEHWVVVSGTAKVTLDDKEIFVRSGESTFVQSGVKHRLENPGKLVLNVIEVALGEYLGEDDIVRLEDDFGRIGDEA